jgi:UDP-hydrolysing UDP-N-acetyl-D-glucosamine 2-epimerase
MDLVAEVTANGGAEIDAEWLEREGVGGHLRIDEPFLLVSQHPVTTEYGQAEQQITETLMALKELGMPAIMLWPNVDAGSEDVSRGMRKFREKHRLDFIRFYKNFPVETYLRLMKSAACLVGNSSSSIREGAFIGVPAVNIGSRQDGRERGPNVVDAPHDRRAIADAIRRQVAHGRYPAAHIYGDGHAGTRIADVLARAPLHVQKRIQY